MTLRSQTKDESLNWWHADERSVGRMLTSAAAAQEKLHYQRRFLSMTCRRYLLDRDPGVCSLSYSMTPKSTALLNRYTAASRWTAPVFNLVATCAETYSARVFKNVPWVEVESIANTQAQSKAKWLSRWLDGLFDEVKLTSLAEEIGVDAMATGIGVVKICPSIDGKKVRIIRVDPDELLVSSDSSDQLELKQRYWIHRDILLAQFAHDEDAIRAIKAAKGASPSFSPVDGAGDMVPVVEGWTLKLGDVPGRYLMAIGDYAAIDEEYDRERFPFSILRFSVVPGAFYSQGLAEKLLSLQRDIIKKMDSIWMAERQVSQPWWFVQANSGVTPSHLAGGAPGRVVQYQTAIPKMETGKAMDPQVYAYLQTEIELGMRRARISQQTIDGSKAPGINSGAGLLALNQIEDAAHADLGQRMEAWVKDVAEEAVYLASQLKPSVRRTGSDVEVIDWDDGINLDHISLTAFPISRLSQTTAARQEQIARWYADGQITRAQKLRLEGMPDTAAHYDEATASEAWIDQVLDTITAEATWIAPEPYIDLPLALQKVQSRILMLDASFRRRKPKDVTAKDRQALRLLITWSEVVAEQIADAAGAGSAPPAGAVGVQPAPGAAPAAPPPQAIPTIAAPAAA